MKMRASSAPLDNKAFQCCLCCHVKTGTLLYGILVAAVNLIVLGLLVLAAIHPDVLKPENNDAIVATPIHDGDGYQNLNEPYTRQRLTKDNFLFAFGKTVVYLVATLAMIYGVARNSASCLMPFFCLQVFDFCLSCLMAISCFTYAASMKNWIRQEGMEDYPFMDRVLCMDNDNLILFCVTILILALSLKAYLIGMVWSCYKYIQLSVQSRNQMREFNTMNEEVLLPPCYEDAIKVPADYQPPPAYATE